MPSAQAIAELLQKIRDQRGISERGLAAALGVSPNALNSWTRGIRTPDPPHVWRIAELAGLSIEEAMRIAGHLPPRAAPEQLKTTRPEESMLLAVASELDEVHLDVLLEISHALRRRQQRLKDS